jgi:hypothetical protein
MTKKTGKIKKLSIREVLEKEDKDFTPWLEENIDQLSDIIGIDIEGVKREKDVGDFSCDLVGTEVNSEDMVIIENQYNRTDHDHLGKIVTYASGVGAKYVVWIAEKIREEHKKALEWLNEISTEGVSFFGVEVGAIQIDNSIPAINFDLIIEPNTWGREVKQRTEQIDERHQKYIQFFTRLVAEYEKLKPEWGHLTPGRAAWMAFGAGKAGFRFCWSFRGNNRFDTELFIDTGDREQNKENYNKLKEFEEEINQQIPDLEWEELPDRKGSRIVVYYQMSENVKKISESDMDKLAIWAIEKMDLFKKVFTEYIKKID